MTKAFARVLGYLIVQEEDVKNRSSLSKRGLNCLLDQVKCLPWSGISMTPKALIASLNRSISLTSPQYLFLSSGF